MILWEVLLLALPVLAAAAAGPTITSGTANQATRVDLKERATTTAVQALQSNICGWQAGDPGKPWECVIDGQCVIATTSSINAIGCCRSGLCNTFRTACIPATQSCNSACSSNGANLICSSASPPCATFTYPSAYTEVRCVASTPASSDLQIAYTYTGFSAPLALPTLAGGFTNCTSGFCEAAYKVQTQTPKPTTSLNSGTTSTGKTTTSTRTGTPGSQTSPASSRPKDSTNTGAIAGGVVGGVAVVALAAVAIFFLRYRSHKNRRDSKSIGSKPTSDTPLGAMTGEGADYSIPGQLKAELPAFEDDPTKQPNSHPGGLRQTTWPLIGRLNRKSLSSTGHR